MNECVNCGHEWDDVENFCPMCGQDSKNQQFNSGYFKTEKIAEETIQKMYGNGFYVLCGYNEERGYYPAFIGGSAIPQF